MSLKIESFKKIPICSFITVSLVIIFSLYFTNVFKSIPCEKNMTNTFISNFIHVDFIHLCSNIFSLYSLSVIEERLGSKQFFILLLFFLMMNTILESILHKIMNLQCSIGFSGVLFSIVTYELLSNKVLDINILISIVANLFTLPLKDKKISFYGHVIGVISGILSVFLFSKSI
jgi:membrane associated rhomboid family serine protease